MSEISPAQAAEHFIEQMGLISQEDGAPRIAGRIFGLLLVEGRAMTLNEIAERLQVSKASASTNARLLAGRDILRRTAHAGDRQDYYELASDTEYHFLDTVGLRMRKTAAQIAESAELFTSDDGARERVGRLADFYRKSAEFMAEWSLRLKDNT